jgi:hypothetical protein
MKTIEERADAYVGHPEEIDEFTSATIKRDAYIRGAKEQKAIDVDNACIILCRYACPHKIDSNKCWNTECDIREIFRRMMEE